MSTLEKNIKYNIVTCMENIRMLLVQEESLHEKHP